MNILVRADASDKIGTGHIMRCFALAQALQEANYLVTFLMATTVPTLETRLFSEGIDVKHLDVNLGSSEDARQIITTAKQLHANFVIVDGYQFGSDYQLMLKEAGLKILFLDDYGHAEHYYADLVLNQNLSANLDWYCHRESYTELLLGCSYSLLRREFGQWQEWQRQIPEVAKKILITLGGSDPDNVTLKVMQALQYIKVEDLEILVVVGGSNPHDKQLKTVAQSMPSVIRLVKNANNMPELMAWADLAIAAGGSTNWELAFMGLPTVVITLADNQREVAQKLDEMGIVVNLGWHEDQTETAIAQIQIVSHLLIMPEQRQSMSQTARQLVDGKGSQRVVEKIHQFME
jgi:UDP-2,4-diacetamido-2,4,6-trideoxy-beta-L-altropyranose hydrolase